MKRLLVMKRVLASPVIRCGRDAGMVQSPLYAAMCLASDARYASQKREPSASASPPSSRRQYQPHPRTQRPTSASSSLSASDQQLTALHKEVDALRQELRQARLQLAHQQSPQSSLHDFTARALQQLAKTDEQAQTIATELRYTGMALQCSEDRLEAELRRLLAIGLTEDEVDAAAMEAGARRYVRSNVGYRVEHVSDEAASTVDVAKSRDGVSTTSKRF